MAGGNICELVVPYITLPLFHRKFGCLREDEKDVSFLSSSSFFNLVSPEEIIQFHKKCNS